VITVREPQSSHPRVPNEPALEIERIQGNVLPGFNKPFQAFLFLKLVSPAQFQHWLGSLIPGITAADEVFLFRQVLGLRGRHDGAPAPTATWTNIAFSYGGLTQLTADARNFRDSAFRQGLAARSKSLGDPTDAGTEGHAGNWVVGGPGNEADVLIVVASDGHDELLIAVARIEQSLSGARVIFKQEGATLPEPLKGHEHFGFEDGVSQPGLRGRRSADPTDVLTPRQNPLNREQGKPGQDLLWPGEFLFGYPGQNPTNLEEPGEISQAGPGWARNGSFLVVRRLRQDVPAFHKFLRDTARKLGLDENLFGAKCVGRWTSGAPLLRASQRDNPQMARTDCANNHFEFSSPSPQLRPQDAKSGDDCTDQMPGSDPPALFPPSHGDRHGKICPFAAHIRTVYPRDDLTPRVGGSRSAAELAEAEVQRHRLLRRGIPFGEPYRPSEGSGPARDSGNRGLVFVCFQTSIESQFEYVTKNFVNNPNFKTRGAGFDPIIGQNNKPGARRRRRFRLTFVDRASRERTEVVSIKTDWVIPTGGGYFFAPSLDALEMLARPAGQRARGSTTGTSRRRRPTSRLDPADHRPQPVSRLTALGRRGRSGVVAHDIQRIGRAERPVPREGGAPTLDTDNGSMSP
jgi:Dyp-type peroxidase family